MFRFQSRNYGVHIRKQEQHQYEASWYAHGQHGLDSRPSCHSETTQRKENSLCLASNLTNVSMSTHVEICSCCRAASFHKYEKVLPSMHLLRFKWLQRELCALRTLMPGACWRNRNFESRMCHMSNMMQELCWWEMQGGAPSCRQTGRALPRVLDKNRCMVLLQNKMEAHVLRRVLTYSAPRLPANNANGSKKGRIKTCECQELGETPCVGNMVPQYGLHLSWLSMFFIQTY